MGWVSMSMVTSFLPVGFDLQLILLISATGLSWSRQATGLCAGTCVCSALLACAHSHANHPRMSAANLRTRNANGAVLSLTCVERSCLWLSLTGERLSSLGNCVVSPGVNGVAGFGERDARSVGVAGADIVAKTHRVFNLIMITSIETPEDRPNRFFTQLNQCTKWDFVEHNEIKLYSKS